MISLNAHYFYVHNEKVDHIVKTIGKSNVEVKEGDRDGKIIHLKLVNPVILYRLFRAGIEWKEHK